MRRKYKGLHVKELDWMILSEKIEDAVRAGKQAGSCTDINVEGTARKKQTVYREHSDSLEYVQCHDYPSSCCEICLRMLQILNASWSLASRQRWFIGWHPKGSSWKSRRMTKINAKSHGRRLFIVTLAALEKRGGRRNTHASKNMACLL